MQLSSLIATPYAGTPNAVVKFDWKIGDDIVEGVTSDDELRLVAASGVVAARAYLRDGTFEGGHSVSECYQKESEATENTYADNSNKARRYRSGSTSLICPPYAGGFVMCIVEGGTFKRILAAPFRVGGSPITQVKDVHLDRTEVLPLGRLNITYNTERTEQGDVFVVMHEDAGDNDGMSKLREGPFQDNKVYQLPKGALARGTSLEHQKMGQLSIVVPKTEGRYQVRLMSTPKNGIPFSKAQTPIFEVKTPDTTSTASDTLVSVGSALKGKLEAAKHSVFLGEDVDVSFDFESLCGDLLSELDTIVFYPYGRSEAVVQNNGLSQTVGEARYAGTLTVTAPLTDGCYDVAYYSFADQRPLITSEKPIKVRAAHAVLAHHSELENLRQLKFKAGKATGGSAALEQITVPSNGDLILSYTIDRRLYSAHDRIVIHDELSNVVESAFIGKPRTTQSDSDEDGREVKLLSGHTKIKLYLPGDHIVYYYSAVLKRKLCRLPGFICVIPPASQSLPTAQVTTMKVWPIGHDLHIGFRKVGNDTRPDIEQGQDCLAIFEADQPDFVHTHTRDSSEGMSSALYVRYLRGQVEADIRFPAIDREGKFSVRYMVAINGHFHRVVTTEAPMEVRPRHDPSLAEFHFKALQFLSLHDMPPVNNRFNYGIDDIADPSSTGLAVSIGLDVSIGAKSLQGSTQGHAVPTRKGAPYFRSVLHFASPDSDHDLKVEVYPPKVSSTTEQVMTTYCVREGLARGDDCLVLLTCDLQKLISEVKVAYGQGRADLSMGTIILNPPLAGGRYVIGYFSDKYQSIICVSDTFRVTEGRDEVSTTTGHRASRHHAKLSLTSPTVQSLQHSALLSASHSLVPATRAPRVRCMFVYVSYLQQPFELKGPLNDKQRFPKALAATIGVDLSNPAEVRQYDELERDPTRSPTAENLRQGINWLVHDAQPKDQLIFYFSGAGSRVPVVGENGEESADNGLLPSDFDWAKRVITYRELDQTLFSAVPNGAAVTGIIDACFTSNPHDICMQWKVWQPSSIERPGDEACDHRGVQSIWRQRHSKNISAKTPWRSIACPRGLFPRLSTAPNDLQPQSTSMQLGTSATLFQPYCATHTKEQQDGSGALLLLYEASRCTEHQPQGAWDVFSIEDGCSMGLFTQALSNILEEENTTRDAELAAIRTAAATRRMQIAAGIGGTAVVKDEEEEAPPGMMWWEFHEKICRRLKGTSYGNYELPRLLVGDVAALDTCVFSNPISVAPDPDVMEHSILRPNRSPAL